MAREEYIPNEQDWEEMSDYFAEMQYNCRKFDVRCHSCGDHERDTQANLEAKGWTLSKLETCFRCGESEMATAWRVAA